MPTERSIQALGFCGFRRRNPISRAAPPPEASGPECEENIHLAPSDLERRGFAQAKPLKTRLKKTVPIFSVFSTVPFRRARLEAPEVGTETVISGPECHDCGRTPNRVQPGSRIVGLPVEARSGVPGRSWSRKSSPHLIKYFAEIEPNRSFKISKSISKMPKNEANRTQPKPKAKQASSIESTHG